MPLIILNTFSNMSPRWGDNGQRKQMQDEHNMKCSPQHIARFSSCQTQWCSFNRAQIKSDVFPNCEAQSVKECPVQWTLIISFTALQSTEQPHKRKKIQNTHSVSKKSENHFNSLVNWGEKVPDCHLDYIHNLTKKLCLCKQRLN